MEAIALGIDGTGVFDKKQYRAEMRTSFVSYLVQRTPATLKEYVRGPGWDGLDMSLIVEKSYAFVHLSVAARPQAPIFLTGYSRGGAGVIGVAERLADDGVRVNGMVLFAPWTGRWRSTVTRFRRTSTTWSRLAETRGV